MIVRGPSIALRYATPADAAALFALGQDEQVTRFFSWGPYTDQSQAERYIESVTAQRERGERLEFVIVDRSDTPIGVTGLSEFSVRDRRAVVGTWLGRAHWGTGVNPESKALVMALGFRRLRLLRITAWANPRNGRSVASLERLGFTTEGVLKAWHVHRGVPEDVAVLRFMHDEFDRSAHGQVPVSFEGAPPAAFVTGTG